MLNAYYSGLAANIKKLGSDPEKLYSFDRFESDLKKYGKQTMLFSFIVSQFCIAEQSNIMSMEEFCERLQNGEKCNIFVNFDENKTIRKHLNGIAEDLFDYGYLE